MVGSVLAVENLSVILRTADGVALHAVRGVDLSVAKGEMLCLVGESGCGKSTTALALVDLLAQGAVRTGRIRLFDEELSTVSPDRWEAIRGDRIAMIFQDPMTSLNPVHTIGSQLIEGLLYHDPAVTRGEAVERAVQLLETCGIGDAARRMAQYPHQLSGGLRQRVMIAMALMTRPALLLADEPTTALDVTIQAQILDLLKRLQREFDLGIVLITHDLGIVRHHADRVAVMYAGEIVEAAPAAELFRNPRHPYTRALLSFVPTLESRSQDRLGYLPGIVPSLVGVLEGCLFRERCPVATPACAGPIPKHELAGGVEYRCVIQPDDAPAAAVFADAAITRTEAAPPAAGIPAITIEGVDVTYPVRNGLFGERSDFHALRGIDLAVEAGSALGIVGESGSGKTTLSRIMLGLERPTHGQALLMGREVTTLGRLERSRWIQPVFQDPYSSLNPRKTVETIVGLPLAVHHIGTPAERRARVREMIQVCGLPERVLSAYPAQLSGGQRQRVAIAAALVTTPKIILCDEPTSSLDVSVQAQILNLLSDLRREFGLTLVLISHDLAVIRHMADRIVVMRGGEIVEDAPAASLFADPKSPYTMTLLRSAT